MIQPTSVIPNWVTYGHMVSHIYRRGNHIIGKCQLTRRDSQTVQVWAVEIRQKSRGKGYGKRMMSELVEWIMQEFPCVTTIWLCTEQGNLRAQHVYQEVGFRFGGQKYFGQLTMLYERNKCQTS